jgi:hypothetical protein
MIEYLQNIITPFVDEIKEELDLPVRQKALVIFDCFRGRGQITEDFLYALKSENLVYIRLLQFLQTAQISCKQWI